MKILIVTLVCAVSAVASGALSSAIAWPGAIPVATPFQKTFLTPNTKTVAYATTQYLNAVPLAQVGLRPHFAYQYPQLSPFAPPQHAYYPIGGTQYIPSNFYYPTAPVATYPIGAIGPAPVAPIAPIAPIAPQQPVGSQPTQPQQPSGDSDTSVVDSAEFPNQDQSQPKPQFPPATTFPFPQDSESSFPPNDESSSPQTPQESSPAQQPQGDSPSIPQAPGSPSFPQFPPGSQLPSFPQIPQGLPSFPQFPQQGSGSPSFPSFPQFPSQGSGSPSFPQLPQFPQLPSNPSFPSPSPSPPSSFPAASNDDQGLNDEDTVSVESA